MKNHKLKNIIAFLLLAIICNSCTEAYPLLANTYEEAIVIEATLTNELKNQEIKITKTAKFEDEGIQTVKGAKVIVKDNQNNQYLFEENSEKYISQSAFQAQPGREYTLEVTTSEGKVYQSTSQTLTTVNSIESIIPAVVTNSNNETGIQINVNSYDPGATSKYYRYEYEETYKIIAPRWGSQKLVVTGPESIAVVQNSSDKKTCYSTKNSTDILLTSTNDLAEDRVNFPVRFINKNNYIIGHRYSILVKQYVENLEAYTFHRIMRDISSSGSILSPKQPGVLTGNIKCITNTNENVIGFFDVSTVSEKRIFFNYSDLFPGETGPPYFNECADIPFNFCFSALSQPPCQGETMIYNIDQNLMTYVSNLGQNYIMVNIECGDCTSFSSNIIPPFWTE
ncbi:DUF4249 domain-containing protein [Flavobacterium cheongpyeongense]|uniref:DUF4249 domain-containing protein n=1 Tax=Flavobacterium cheongpyeongense TaxID=2212651 RepID=A0A2V4BRA3_9FLAO|nr:DUF4249 domain-containing protein [Flavobacterium cheongpyeongense]PXY41589.1 DUF4249 domain-containing protein [Flavobacterium cheongpyeongense]